jgi:hypothetical protein
VQRFGRCNRFAECEAAEIHVVTCDKDWPIYGDDLNFIKSLDGDGSCTNLWKRREDVAKLTKVPHATVQSAPVADAVPSFEIIDASVLAKRLNLPESWVREQCRSRAADPIPHLKFGRYIRFQWLHPDLVNWLERRRSGK